MATNANPYRFGDLLALARQSWIRRMASELADRGFTDYRITDAAVMRQLRRGPVPVGQLGADLGVTRQAARKVVRGLQERGYANTEPDADDARKLNVILTAAGRAYASAITEVIARLNRALAAKVTPEQLAAADTVLRESIEDDQVALRAQRIPPPRHTARA
ncbi:MAG: MarR family winged helix-turn-helix transcriptional regulator [Streptosporangiaceae bacterium]